MANLIRSAKSGSDWTINELLAFNIQVVPANTTVFFRNPELPQLSISPMILDNLQMPDGNILDNERDFFLHLPSVENGFEESAVDFAALLLRLLKYNSGRQRMIRSRKEISFIMAGQRVDAKTDICNVHNRRWFVYSTCAGGQGDHCQLAESNFLLPSQHQGQAYLHDIEPQLVDEAIAAWHRDDQHCCGVLLDSSYQGLGRGHNNSFIPCRQDGCSSVHSPHTRQCPLRRPWQRDATIGE